MARFEGLTQWSSLGNFESFLVVGSVSAVIAVHFGWAFLHPEPLLELEPEVLSSRPLIFRLPQLLNAAECAELQPELPCARPPRPLPDQLLLPAQEV